MNSYYLNIYNNLIKLTRNKILFDHQSKKDTFSDRLIIFFIHFAFFLKVYKNQSNKNELQKLYDFVFKHIELSIREIGYGDASINKRMKQYVNLMYSIIEKIEIWDKLNLNEKSEFFSNFLQIKKESNFLIEYFNKYAIYLSKKSFNYFTKDVISHKF